MAGGPVGVVCEMAIEFHCPYCTAVIRVADEFAGRTGRCPKCETRMQIPNISPPAPAGAASNSPGFTESETTPGIGGVADRTQDALRPAESPVAGSPVAAAPVAATQAWDIPAVPSAIKAVKPWQRRTRRRRSSRVWLVGVPVIGFLILLAVLAAMMMNRLPELSGSLQAQKLSERTLPHALIPWSAAEVSVEEQAALQSTLAEFPESFSSELMTCSLNGTRDGIEVRLKPADGYALFVVTPESHPPLMLWGRHQQGELSALRVREMYAQTAEYCRDKLRSIGGERIVINAAVYRDAVGLNAHLNSLGYVVEAVAAGRATRCVHEDDLGHLYFLLPQSTTSFVIRGRLMADGKKMFPGEYQVSVIAATAESPPTTNAEPIKDPSAGKSDTEQDAKPESAMDDNAPATEPIPETDPNMKSEPDTKSEPDMKKETPR